MTDRLFQIFWSRSLRQYSINYKFHASVRLLTIKISNERARISAVIVKNLMDAPWLRSEVIEIRVCIFSLGLEEVKVC